jgi:hypothetical protein
MDSQDLRIAGDINHNIAFRRFHVRTIAKVKTEITPVAMAHNLGKSIYKG